MDNIPLWISATTALAITVGAIFVLRPIAVANDFLDHPGGRKSHHGAVPLVGGLAMLLGLVLGIASHGNLIGSLQQYLYSAVLLTVIGILDDRFDLAPAVRLLAQFLAVL